jgi:hypothetical protein
VTNETFSVGVHTRVYLDLAYQLRKSGDLRTPDEVAATNGSSYSCGTALTCECAIAACGTAAVARTKFRQRRASPPCTALSRHSWVGNAGGASGLKKAESWMREVVT